MSRDRRIHPRTESRMAASLTCGADAVEGVVENVGAGGVFFATEQLEIAVDEGADVIVTLHRPGIDEPVTCPGSVLRADRYFDGARVVRAFAIRFHDQIDLEALGIAQ